MPEMRQRVADSYREIRAESGAAILGMLDISQVQSRAKPLRKPRTQHPSVFRLNIELPLYGELLSVASHQIGPTTNKTPTERWSHKEIIHGFDLSYQTESSEMNAHDARSDVLRRKFSPYL